MKFLSLILGTAAFLAGFAVAADYTNPIRMNGPDPFIVYDNGYYYFTTTTNVDLEITRATTLWGLASGERKTAYSTPETIAGVDTWAPEVHKINGTWYMYYSTSNQNTSSIDYQGSHVLQGGASPWDDYHYLGQLTNNTLWSIDGTVLALNSKNYFVWSCITSTALAANAQHLCIAELLTPSTIGTVGVISAPTHSWETVGLLVNEGPQPLYHGNSTFLVYSASFCWTNSYSLGLLTYLGGDPLLMSSWFKSPNPVMMSSNGNFGPGHNGIFMSPDGTETWNVFHAVQNPYGACDTTRYTMALRVNFDSLGRPVFEQNGIPYIGVALPGPSGEPAQTSLVPP